MPSLPSLSALDSMSRSGSLYPVAPAATTGAAHGFSFCQVAPSWLPVMPLLYPPSPTAPGTSYPISVTSSLCSTLFFVKFSEWFLFSVWILTNTANDRNPIQTSQEIGDVHCLTVGNGTVGRAGMSLGLGSTGIQNSLPAHLCFPLQANVPPLSRFPPHTLEWTPAALRLISPGSMSEGMTAIPSIPIKNIPSKDFYWPSWGHVTTSITEGLGTR